jgi:hypothetical protein
MYMIIQKTKSTTGAYAIYNDKYEKILLFFEDLDDAERYAMMIETEYEDRTTKTVEVNPRLAVETCNRKNINYTIITPDDFIIPPKNDHI